MSPIYIYVMWHAKTRRLSQILDRRYIRLQRKPPARSEMLQA